MNPTATAKPLRVFIGMREIAGYYRSLKKGFDQLGIENVFVCLGYNKFRYEIENNPRWVRVINRLSEYLGYFFTRNWALRVIWIGIIQNIFGIFVFLLTFWRYDVFIMGSISTFFFFLELPILKLMGKKVIHVFNGSDSRPVYANGYVIQNHRKLTILVGIVLARVQKVIISIVDRWADFIINIPPQAYFHTRPIANGYIIGFPFEKEDVVAPRIEREAGVVRILHAPSKPGPKGTAIFRQVIEVLKRKGHRIEWIEIIGRPNHEVIQEIQNCDFVVDELYSDMPLALFAVEAAYFGKPAVVGGYYSREVPKILAPEDVPPSLFCLPEDIEASIEKMIVDREFRVSLGNRAKEFVRSRWAPKEVARRVLDLVRGEHPKHWMYNPREIRYLEGCGHSAEQARKTASEFLRMGGASVLCLDDKAELRDLFVSFAKVQD